MSYYPAPATWWPTAVAGVLLALAGGGLWRVLPAAPLLPLPEPLAAAPAPTPMTTTTMQDGHMVAIDTASVSAAAALAAEEAELRQKMQQLPADTTVHFGSYNPLEDESDSLTHPPQRYRRYLGTLGGKAIVLWLSTTDTDTTGSWYYRSGPQAHERALRPQRWAGRPVLLEDLHTNTRTDRDTATTEWHFASLRGSILSARRTGRYSQRSQAVQLREDYSQAQPYELLRLTAHGNYCREEPGRSQPYYSSQFIHLLGADSLRLRIWQAPLLPARQDTLRQWLLSESCQQVVRTTWMTINDYNVLSYVVWETGYYYGAHPEHGQYAFMVDLTTGREWQLSELLRPGTEPALLKLLARHLRQDYPELTEDEQWHWKTVPPLPDAYALTPTGLYAGYDDYALTAYVAHYADNTTIPYTELRPLLRPGTPLARLLAARGLW